MIHRFACNVYDSSSVGAHVGHGDVEVVTAFFKIIIGELF